MLREYEEEEETAANAAARIASNFIYQINLNENEKRITETNKFPPFQF